MYDPNSTVFKISFLSCGYLTLHLHVFNISISLSCCQELSNLGNLSLHTVIWESSRLLRYHVLVRCTCQAFFGGPVECSFQMDKSQFSISSTFMNSPWTRRGSNSFFHFFLLSSFRFILTDLLVSFQFVCKLV